MGEVESDVGIEGVEVVSDLFVPEPEPELEPALQLEPALTAHTAGGAVAVFSVAVVVAFVLLGQKT